jgi:hypothetical protein
MTRHRDIEPVLDAWFVDGPSEMPDRLFQAVFDQVERVPQRRLARLHLRFTEMSVTARWIAAAAAAILVVGFGLFAFGRAPDSSNVAASPPPSPSPSASPAVVPLPSELRHPFLGALRQHPDIPASQDRSVITFASTSFAYNDTYFRSSASALAADQIQLVAQNVAGGCAVGDVGLYSWALSPGGSKMTLTADNDSCPSRAAVIAGEWQRSVCRNPDNFCLGALEPGRYSSQFFAPALEKGATWRADFGALSYTVPEGWANYGDWPDTYTLMTAAAYSSGAQNEGQVVPDQITLLARPAAAILHANCAERPEPGVGTSAQELAGWIMSHPGLVATPAGSMKIDGLDATIIDLRLAPDWTETCDDQQPFIAAPLYVGAYHWSVNDGDRMRTVLLDLPGGNAVAIVVDSEDPAALDALVDQAMPIISSFNFTP